MVFKNEYVLPLEQETSEFFRKAQKTLNAMAERRSKWTVDREREMVLLHRGGGHSMESKDHDNWGFLDRKGKYFIGTECLSKSEISPEEIEIARSFYCMVGGGDIAPDAETITAIKEVVREYKDWGVISDYKSCQLTLIDARTGEEV